MPPLNTLDTNVSLYNHIKHIGVIAMEHFLTWLEDLTYPESLPPEYFEITKCQSPYLNAIQEQFSLDFLDDFVRVQSEETNWLRREAFSRGFRLGAKLILALAPPSAPDTHHRS